MKEFLSLSGVEYAYLDITESLMNLKAFLKFRDSKPEFAEIREKGRVGLPCIVVDNGEKIFFEQPNVNELK